MVKNPTKNKQTILLLIFVKNQNLGVKIHESAPKILSTLVSIFPRPSYDPQSLNCWVTGLKARKAGIK